MAVLLILSHILSSEYSQIALVNENKYVTGQREMGLVGTVNEWKSFRVKVSEFSILFKQRSYSSGLFS
jgi:hypothetical protein